jgi:hypothetical protein
MSSWTSSFMNGNPLAPAGAAWTIACLSQGAQASIKGRLRTGGAPGASTFIWKCHFIYATGRLNPEALDWAIGFFGRTASARDRWALSIHIILGTFGA